MFKHFLTIYLPAAVILLTITVAGVMLYQTNDPTLDQVEFVPAPVEVVKTDAVAEIDSTISDVGETLEFPVPNLNEPIVAVVQTEPDDTAEVTAVVVTTTVTISGPGVSKRCTVTLPSEQVVHRVMQQASADCGFAYAWKNYPSLGVFVTDIAGISSNKTKGRYWIYYVNGTKANVGVSAYQLQPGDQLAWQFEQEY